MKIILGSKSEDKLNILINCLSVNGIEYSEVIQVDVSSDISDQPLSEDETIQGATNRAKNAFATVEGVNGLIAVGLEGGLLKKNGVYNLICAAAIYDGEKLYIGKSKITPLPVEVSEHIHNGNEFGVKIREYSKVCGPIKYNRENIEELISRKKSFSSAIYKSFAEFLSIH